jgi:hypothetical protein
LDVISQGGNPPPTDTTPPTVTLTAPGAGTVSGTLTVSASATDNVGVAGVQFHLDSANLGGEDTTNAYTLPWDTTTVPDGAYTLTATARDAAGNTMTSAPITVTVSNLSGLPLLADNFDAGTFAGWTIVDEGSTSAPSAWSAATGSLAQTSNIYGGSTSSSSLPKPGTYAVYDAGVNWTDYHAALTVRSTDDDALGVLFRYHDVGNYYRFSWDAQRTYRRLIKVENGIFTLLAEDNVPYSQGQTYQLEITAQGSALAVQIDGAAVLTVTDTSLSSGTLALYSWANDGIMFDTVLVTSIF